MRVSGVEKAFGATFVDIEGLKYVASLAYRKGGSLFVYLKGEELDQEGVVEEVQGEIEGVFREVLRLEKGDVGFRDRHTAEYRFTVLNEKNVKKAFARLHRIGSEG